MKTWMKVLLGIGAVIILAVAGGFYFTSGVTVVADDFFKAAREKDIKKAHGYLAKEFKAMADENVLADYLVRSSLGSVKDTSWSSRQVSGGRGELVGSVTTDAGASVPLRMTFVKEADGWKIYSIQKPTAGVQTESASPALPGKAEQGALVRQSTASFVASVNARDMGTFRNTTSSLWQKQFTAEQLNQAYKAVIDSGANWTVLNGLEPILTPEATIDQDGVLTIEGYYPTTPSRVHFKQKYVFEGAAWKLLGFHIQAKRE
ncbi:MAG: hypothetical protein VB032_03125 [Burkholderiaceae bacterium]|nr:hypothetical protein [Burkholderiaceae bacterium]